MGEPLSEQIMEQVRALRPEQQRQVLSFARALNLSKPVGTPWKELLRFVGAIPRDDLKRMAKAIEEGCERIDPNEW